MQINDGKKLFQQGIDSFNKMRFYDAHEYWEELWLEYKLNDALFVQGLIQLAVSYFHFFNGLIFPRIYNRFMIFKSF